jgi:xanthine dehydrogenase YagR molybdenum-binding subunit
VITEYVGGAFGSKGSAWSHVVLAAMAAKLVRGPVKLVLSRRQMFGLVGARPYTRQRVVLGASRDGTLLASRHLVTASTSELEDWLESSALVTRSLYNSPAQETTHDLVKLNTGTPTFNRAPGESSGLFALESAIDELAIALALDPIELRLRNHADRDPETGRPWSSKSLKACYAQGAEAFGWSRRTPAARSMRDGNILIGYGMASATRPAKRQAASALVRLLPTGRAAVQAATEDLGTGTYTILTQLAGDALGLPLDRVQCELGDSAFPENPISAGSMTASSAGPAVHLAATAVRDQIIGKAVGDARSPLHGASPEDVKIADGRLFLASDSSRGETYEAILARQGGHPVEATVRSAPGDETTRYAMNAFGAVFAEVRVDADLGEIRVPRVVGAYGVGRVLNAKTARSQLMGGIVYGISMALLEATALDQRSGRYLNTDLSEYLVPVNADIGSIDIIVVDETDPYVNPIGVKGLGEVSMTGVAAAVANAVYHATGVRVRDLPITLDTVLGI